MTYKASITLDITADNRFVENIRTLIEIAIRDLNRNFDLNITHGDIKVSYQPPMTHEISHWDGKEWTRS